MSASILEVARVFLKLGCLSFGGPIAHLGYLHSEFVKHRRWIQDEEFADLVALCQFLPGPASSQLVFALGKHRAGTVGAMVASLCFLAPSALIMLIFGICMSLAPQIAGSNWIHGLKLAAVVFVAQAVWTMGIKLVPDFLRLCICVVSVEAALLFANPAVQIASIVMGGLIGWRVYRDETPAQSTVFRIPFRRHWGATLCLFLFGILLFLPWLLGKSEWGQIIAEKPFSVFESFFRSGALVFGGGHVVLPLLRAELVPQGLISDNAFLAGYGAAQALPGPLFAFAAYLGAIIFGASPVLGGLLCLFAIFVPAWLLIGGTLPFWHALRRASWAQASLKGTNAAVVGVLAAAFYNPIILEGVKGDADAVIAILALTIMKIWNTPALVVVLFCLTAGFVGTH